MFKICILFALVATVSALQDAAPEAGPEPYSYAYQTDSHGAAEQRDPAGRVTGYYTLADADGRERRVEYVADEQGFRAKVQTNEMGTKAESPANVEVQAAEPSPAQYAAAAQYATGAAPAVQGAQYTRQAYVAAAAPASSSYAANYQQYAYRPYGATSYYANAAYPYAAYNGYGSNYNGAYGGYGSAAYYAGGYPSSAYYSTAAYPASYYGSSASYGPASQYYSYRSSAAAPAPAAAYQTTGTASGYRYYAQPAAAVTTTYRQVAGTVPTAYSAGFPTVANGAASSTSSRAFQGSSNYLILKKRDAENKQEKAAASS